MLRSATLVLALMGPPGTVETAPAPSSTPPPSAAPTVPHRDCDDTQLPTLRVASGAAPARLTLHVFVDPLADELLTTWHRARRIALTSEGEVDVELRVVRRELATTALEREVEHFAVLALAQLATSSTADTTQPKTAPDVERISHFIQRHGVRGVAATMRRPELRAEAEGELGLPLGTLGPSEAIRRCVQLRLDHDTQWVMDRQREDGGGMRSQPPWIAMSLDGATLAWWSDDRSLRETPVRVDEWRRSLRLGGAPSSLRGGSIPGSTPGSTRGETRWFDPPEPSRSGSSARTVVPSSIGLRIGGAGLPHEVVVFLGGENDPALQWALPKLLALRETYLGQLAVTVVARDTPEAAPLAARLCAARRLDLAVPFLRALLAKVRRQVSAEWVTVSARIDAEIEATQTAAANTNERTSTGEGTSATSPLGCATVSTDPRTSRAISFDGTVVGFDDLERVEATLRAASPDASTLWLPPVSVSL